MIDRGAAICVKSTLTRVGDSSVTTKSTLLRQAAMLLKHSKTTADPELAASLVQKAADLQMQADTISDETHTNENPNDKGPNVRLSSS